MCDYSKIKHTQKQIKAVAVIEKSTIFKIYNVIPP